MATIQRVTSNHIKVYHLHLIRHNINGGHTKGHQATIQAVASITMTRHKRFDS